MWDSVILMVMALVVFGPRRLPEIGRQIGKLMYEFRKASNEFKYQMEEELRSAEEADRLKKQEARLKELGVTIPAAPALEASVTSETASSETIPPVTIASLVAESEAKSPYPGEETYPATPSVDLEAPAQETVPRILPPSTGDPVPAARPGSLAAQVQSTELPAEQTVQEQP